MPTKIQKNQIATTLLDGWTPADATWTYASASTITVPSGAASIYQKGDRIKWTQTTVKYGVIVAVADTLLTIAVNTDYTVTDAAISANYYSHQANPLGYPTRFAFTSTVTKPTGMTGTTVVGACSYQITGGLVSITVQAYVDPAGGTITGTDFDMSIPLTLIGEANGGNSLATAASVFSNATAFGGTRIAFAVVNTTKTISIRPLAGATWTGATYAYVYCCLNGILA